MNVVRQLEDCPDPVLLAWDCGDGVILVEVATKVSRSQGLLRIIHPLEIDLNRDLGQLIPLKRAAGYTPNVSGRTRFAS